MNNEKRNSRIQKAGILLVVASMVFNVTAYNNVFMHAEAIQRETKLAEEIFHQTEDSFSAFQTTTDPDRYETLSEMMILGNSFSPASECRQIETAKSYALLFHDEIVEKNRAYREDLVKEATKRAEKTFPDLPDQSGNINLDPMGKVAEEMENRDGMIGILSIPEADVDVALICTGISDPANQRIVDEKDSAVYMSFSGGVLIADRESQAFSGLKLVTGGLTKAYINDGSAIISYVCTKTCYGTNTGHDLLDETGNSVCLMNHGDLCMYTGDTNGIIFLTFWRRES